MLREAYDAAFQNYLVTGSFLVGVGFGLAIAGIALWRGAFVRSCPFGHRR